MFVQDLFRFAQRDGIQMGRILQLEPLVQVSGDLKASQVDSSESREKGSKDQGPRFAAF